MWAAADADPLNAVDFDDLATFGSQTTESNTKSETNESHQKVNDQKTGDFPLTLGKANNPLKGNGNLPESHQVTKVNTSYRADDYPELPDCLRRSPLQHSHSTTQSSSTFS